jgi:poly(3-hydroxybutyrate) depolymerase
MDSRFGGSSHGRRRQLVYKPSRRSVTDEGRIVPGAIAPKVFAAMKLCISVALSACVVGGNLALQVPAVAADIQSVFNYQSTVTPGSSGGINLRAELNYDSAVTNAPIAVVMHGYSPTTGNFDNVRGNAQRLRDNGFFVISVAMRGRDGSQGVRDSGGVEVYDIYDAVEAVKDQFSGFVDETNVHITGYSGGGGNVMSALTKFPDYFRAGSSFFGISDYGFNTTNGWYHNGAASNHRAQLHTDIGNPLTGGASALDRYHARASNLAARNNPYSEIHLFVDNTETTCPPVNVTGYRDSAVANEASAGEFSNINVHIGDGLRTRYQDFNENGVNEPNELQRWPHGFPTANQQDAGELWYRDRLLAGEIAQPVLNSADELYVTGFVKTVPFEFWLGDGQNGAGKLTYELSSESKSFNLDVQTSDLAIASTLEIETGDMAGRKVHVLLNGNLVETITGGATYESTLLGHEDTLLLRVAINGDYDHSGIVDEADYSVWKQIFGSTTALAADGNENGVVDLADYTIWRDELSQVPVGELRVSAVPELSGHVLAVLACTQLGWFRVLAFVRDSRSSTSTYM